MFGFLFGHVKKQDCLNTNEDYQSKKRRKNSWSYRLKSESNHVTWKYQFTTRVELTPMISSNMEVYHYNNKLVHTCTRLRNRWHLQPPRDYQ